jgi:hypothetical protein
MTMTKQDHTEIKELFADGIAHINQVQELKMKLIDQKLDSIIEQTTRTNGTVRKHTEQLGLLEKSLPHSVDGCPQNMRIAQMWEERAVGKGVKSWKIAVGSGAVAVISAIVTCIAIFEFILKYNP